MEVVFGIIGILVVLNVLGKILGTDEEGQQKKAQAAEAAAEQAFVEMFGKALGSIAAIGVHAASADGTISPTERSMATKWLHDRIDDIKEQYQAPLRRYANTVYTPNCGKLSERELREYAAAIPEDAGNLRQEAIQLAFKVVASDGVLSPGEYQTLQGIQKALGITESRFRDLYDLHISQLRRPGAAGGQGPQVDELGVDPKWPKERKRAHLIAEFGKQNARMQSVREEAQRAHCKRMIELISRELSKLDGNAQPKKANPDEVLLGIDSDLGISDKKAALEREESRWIARKRVTQTPSGLQKCEEALEAAARLRSLYRQAA